MKTLISSIAVFFVLFLMQNFAGAGSTDLESVPDELENFYNEHIDMKIKAAERHSEWGYNENPEIACMAEMAQTEKEFYKKNREKLVREMYERGIGKKGGRYDDYFKDNDMYKAHYFLINAFHEEHPEAMTKCLTAEKETE